MKPAYEQFLRFFNTSEKRLYYTGLLLLLVALALFAFAASEPFRQFTFSYPLAASFRTEPIVYDAESFDYLIFPFSIQSFTYVFWADYNPTAKVSLSLLPHWIWLGLFVFSFSLGLVVISEFKKWWRYGGLVIPLGTVYMMNWQEISFLGLPTEAAYVTLMVILTAFVLGIGRTPLSFAQKWMVSLGLVVAMFLLLLGKNGWAYLPALVPHVMLFPIVMTIFFFVIVGYDLPSGFLQLLSDKKSMLSGPLAMPNWLIFNTLYLGNLVLLYLRNRGDVDYSGLTINPFFLLGFAALAGIQGYARKEELFNYIMEFKPTGIMAFFALGINALACISLAFTTGNDPLIEAFEDGITLVFLCFGFMFFLYSLINFIDLIRSGLNVYLVLYDPKYMPVASIQVFGLVFAAMAVLGANQIQYKQALAGYYNAQADLALILEDRQMAKGLYMLSSEVVNRQHRSNYMLSVMAEQANDYNQARKFAKEASDKNVVPQTFLHQLTLFPGLEDREPVIQALREGLNMLPKSHELMLQLSREWGKQGNLDSAATYLHKASLTSSGYETGLNVTAAQAASWPSFNIDAKASEPSEIKQLNNFYAARIKTKTKPSFTYTEAILDSTEYANYAALTLTLAQYQNLMDNKDLDRAIDSLSSDDFNKVYQPEIQYAKSLRAWHRGATFESIELLTDLAKAGVGSESFLAERLGVTMMQLQRYKDAAYWLGRSDGTSLDAATKLGLMQTEADGLASTVGIWGKIAQRIDDPNGTSLPSRLNRVGSVFSWNTNLDDFDKMLMARFRPELIGAENAKAFLMTFSDQDLGCLTAALLAEYCRQNQATVPTAQAILAGLAPQAKGADPKVYAQFLNAQLELAIQIKDPGIVNQVVLESKAAKLPLMLNAFAQLWLQHQQKPLTTSQLTKAMPILALYKTSAVWGVQTLAASGDKKLTYDWAQRITVASPNEPVLLMQYIRAANDLGYMLFVDDALTRLERMVSPETYKAFRNEFPNAFKTQSMNMVVN